MNVTLCLLRATWLFGQSSALNMAQTTYRKHTALNRVSASRFTAPFLTGASSLRVKDSSFERFLSSAFRLNGEITTFDRRQEATNTIAEFVSSKFAELGNSSYLCFVTNDFRFQNSAFVDVSRLICH